MQLQDILRVIGDKIAEISSGLIKKISEFGVNINEIQAKIISLLVILVIVFIVIKFVELPKKVIKYLIIALLIVLALSIIFSFA